MAAATAKHLHHHPHDQGPARPSPSTAVAHPMHIRLISLRPRLSCARTALLTGMFSALLATQACGGGEIEIDANAERETQRQSQIESLTQQADTQAAKARTLGVDAPCDTQARTQQCGGLWLSSATTPCAAPIYHPYATQAPSASAAEAAAEIQRQYAADAIRLRYPTTACPALFPMPPVFVCRAHHCVAEAASTPQ